MKAKAIVILATLSLSALIYAQTLPLSRSPLFVRPPVDPNIILSFDDSGSMNEAGTPNEITSNIFLPNSNAAGRCYWRDLPHFYAAQSNNQYFDPLVTYAPPVYANGSNFPDAVFTAAYYDGFDAHRTGTENTTMPTRNLAKDYAVSIYGTVEPNAGLACSPVRAGRSLPPTNGDLITFGAASQATCTTTTSYRRCSDGNTVNTTDEGGVREALFPAPNDRRAFYFTYNNTNPIDPMTGKPAKPTTAQLYGNLASSYNKANYSGPFLVTADQETNFANWYSYYRTRQLMGRTAASRAFSQLPRNVRIGWQGITYSTISNTFAIKKIEDNTHRGNFYSYLFNVPATAGTPTRKATDRVGNYFTRNASAGFVESNPYYDKDLGIAIGNATSPATLVSCRQNYHLIFTDGGWKDNIGQYTGQNFDQTAITPLPSTWTPTGLVAGPNYSLADANTYLYRNGPNQNSIGGFADRAFYYWSRDLSDLKNNVTPFIDDRSIGITDTSTRVLPANVLADGEVYWNPKNDPATWQHVVQYVVAFGLQSSLNFPADLNNLRKGPLAWSDWSTEENLDKANKVDDTWHAALNSRGELLAASNPQEVVQQLNSVFQAISARTSSVSAVSVAASLLSTNTFAYRTFFNASAWSGSVQASTFNNTGGLSVVWDASCLLTGGTCSATGGSFTAPDPMTGRQIYTASNTGTAGAAVSGVDFRWSQLSFAQQQKLNYNWDTAAQDPSPIAPETKSGGEKRVEFLRGVRTEEGLLMRSRESVLGAVVNSNAVFVSGATDAYWSSTDKSTKVLFPGGSETKANFLAHAAAMKSRLPTIYVGANDGMLHAFDANTGAERWAYVPNTAYRYLSRLTSKFNLFTQSSVDNTPTLREAYIKGAWRTMLVGSMRLGGQGIFALDVTDSAPTGAASKVMWEFNDESTLGGSGVDLGYTYGRPFITRVAANNKWVVLVPGGYNSSDNDSGRDTKLGTGLAVLFVLDASNGSIIKKFDLPGTTRGLSSVVAGDYVFGGSTVTGRTQFLSSAQTGDEITDVAFAGDDYGNLWRFDLEGNVGRWNVKQFFKGTSVQKITAQPRIVPANDSVNGQPNLAVVAFGTGRYVATPDRGDNSQQSIYGVFDPGPNYTGYPLEQSDLQQQSRTESVVGTKVLITTGDLPVPATKLGWYFDLGTNGERAIASASFLASTNSLIVPTFIPTIDPLLANDPCVDDSSSVLYFLDPLNGGAASTDDLAAFDVNGDGVINSLDNKLISGVRVPGFVAGATPITQAGGGQGAILLPAPPGSGTGAAISTLAIPDFVWRRQSTRDIPAFDQNERN